MLALRLVYVLALAVWLGGMTILGAVVAPTIFQTMQAADPESGRALAGLAFGAMLARFHYVAYGCGVLLLVTHARDHGAPRPAAEGASRSAARWWRRCCSWPRYSGVVVLTEIDAIQQEVGSLPSSCPRAIRGASASTSCTSSRRG